MFDTEFRCNLDDTCIRGVSSRIRVGSQAALDIHGKSFPTNPNDNDTLPEPHSSLGFDGNPPGKWLWRVRVFLSFKTPKQSHWLTFRTEEPIPSFVAHTLKGNVTRAMLTARQWNASIASLTVESQIASTLAWSLAIALLRIASLATDRNVAKIPLPPRQTDQVSVVIAGVMRVIGLRNFTRLLLPFGHVTSWWHSLHDQQR